ncbi:MAG: S1 RNA-binding domain-containing protein [archaeon]|jgi:translation initiation factor 2 alpha subunit (eIF-2alpha)|nr:S1 RNA-binding domain-containing protein [archaeon]
MSDIKEDDIVMCTVKKIEGTTVFVDIDDNGSGTIVFSEVAAGRIRNIREYVIVGKKIVCKILSIEKGNVHLSLRRVTAKEKEEMKERYEKERTLLGMLKASSKKPGEILAKIKEKLGILEFLEEAKTNPSEIEKFLPKSEAQTLIKIISEKKEKEKEAKKVISVRSLSESGINDIKSFLQSAKGVEIRYLGSSKFSVSSTGKDFKDANHRVQAAIDVLKGKIKEKKVIFECEEK